MMDKRLCVWDSALVEVVSFNPISPCVSSHFRHLNTYSAQRKLLGKSYCPMKDNDIFYCSFLRSLKETVDVRWSHGIEEIISHLYDLVKHFQIEMGPSREDPFSRCRSLAVKLFNTTFYINVFSMMCALSG